MARTRAPSLVLLSVAFAAQGVVAAGAQSASPDPDRSRPSATASGADAASGAAIDHNLERIRRGLDKDSSIDWRLPLDGRAMFRVDIEGKFPDVSTWLGDPRDLEGGPMVAPSYHDEFLRMVTPSDLNASYTNGELVQLLATGLAGGLALKSVVSAIKGALASRGQRAACTEVTDALVQLNAERAKAGLPAVPLPVCRD